MDKDNVCMVETFLDLTKKTSKVKGFWENLVVCGFTNDRPDIELMIDVKEKIDLTDIGYDIREKAPEDTMDNISICKDKKSGINVYVEKRLIKEKPEILEFLEIVEE